MDNLQFHRCIFMDEIIPVINVPDQYYIDDNVCCYFTNPYQVVLRDVSGSKTAINIPPKLIGRVIDLFYLNLWKVVFVATDTNLIAYDVDKSKFSTFDASQKPKMVQVSWNPAQTLLVVADESKALLGYSFSLDSTANCFEFKLTAEGLIDRSVPRSMYVGWGSRNTQFKGLRQLDPESVEISLEYNPPTISWRGNGEMFVVNYWKDKRRLLKVFDTSLNALYESEPYNNLLAPISFRGQGNFIACAATDNGITNRIMIYEKNCLIKTGFLVLDNRGEITILQYHPDKHILAVHSVTTEESYLNIYLHANGTWYLKQQLCFSVNGSDTLLSFHWSSNMSPGLCRFNILTTKGIYVCDYTIEPYGVAHDLVGVINGRKVFFSNFNMEVVPPPMGTRYLEFQRPVNEILYYPCASVYEFCLSNKQSVFHKYSDFEFAEVTNEEEIALLRGAGYTSNTMSSFVKEIDGVSHKIALSPSQELLIDDKVVFNNVLSVHVHKSYLLFTHATAQGFKMCSTRLNHDNVCSLTTDSLFYRDIEQGARIVCVTEDDNVIFVMPRGNLELISCRLIIIDYIESLLTANEWTKAMNKIRREKLNWNLLIDLNKDRFVIKILDFIRAACTVSMLNVIVSEFNTENCLETTYKAWYKLESGAGKCLLESYDTKSKVEILDIILKQLVRMNPIAYIVTIVTLQIKHYTMKAAVTSVLQAFNQQRLDMASNAITQIRRYRQAKEVIDAAYTLFNIEFLYYIFNTCSEDPRLYAPIIEELQSLDTNDLRFSMSVRGKDFETASVYLLRSATRDDIYIADFIKRHETQRAAYNSATTRDSRFKLITKLYAEYLSLQGKHNEAGLILERARLYDEAFCRFKTALNWKKAVSLLNVLGYENERKNAVVQSLAKDLIDNKRIEDGAHVYQYYCNDFKAAVEVLTENKMFTRALGIAREYIAVEELAEVLHPALIEYREALHERIIELDQKFSSHTSRLLNIRHEKCEKIIRARLNNDVEEEASEIDTNSEYGSLISKSSIASTSTAASTSSAARNRRKQEKKKTDLREGGTYEDIALIRQLYILAVDIFKLGQEVAEIAYCMIDEVNFQFAKNLQESLDRIKAKVLRNIPRIWSDTFLNGEGSCDKPEVRAVIENREELDEKYRTPPTLEQLTDNSHLGIF